MPNEAAMRPTLWRTSRAMANRTRLRMFQLLLDESDQTVTAIAETLELSVSQTSQYLRMLEARGLLAARRNGRVVTYRPGTTGSGAHAGTLVAALRATFQRAGHPIESVFRLATAWTHPRRVEIFRLLHVQPRSLGELREATGISFSALRRHLAKLEGRGFIRYSRKGFVATPGNDPLSRELARRAVSGER